MSSGIFGPRAPQLYYRPINPSYEQSRPVYPSYAQKVQYVPPAPSYPSATRYSASPRYMTPSTPVLTTQTGYSAAPLNPVYPASLSYSAGSEYPAIASYYPETLYYSVPQAWMGEPSKGLETVLVAILVLVSLDLVILRPLKQNR